MATALEILPLERIKRELAIPVDLTHDDVLLTGHVGAAVSLCAQITGLDLEDMDVGDVPPQLIQAAVILARIFYDGIQDIRQTNAAWPLIASLRVGYKAAA